MDTKFVDLRKRFGYSPHPIGVALSGGLDSAVVLHELRRMNPPNGIYTYSMKWGNGELSREAGTAERIADAYEVHFKAIKFNPKDYWESLKICMKFFDRPRWNVWPFMILSEASRQGVKDFYIGEGCDEIFGYQDRCYIKGWIGQLEYIQPVWRQIGKHFGMVIHCPFLELENSLGSTGLPTTLHYHCGKFKEAVWNEYCKQFKVRPIYPKVVKSPEYYGVLKKSKDQLLLEATKLWLKART